MKIERRPNSPYVQESQEPIIAKCPNISSDFTWTENRGNGATGTNVNNPMLDTSMMFNCFARAAKRDVILSDTLAKKNPFRPGPNPTDIIDYNRY